MNVHDATIPALEIAARTDSGRDPDKRVNEDAFGHRATRFGHLAVVCDGMGGHAGGKEASERALAAIYAAFDGAAPDAAPREVLRRAILDANDRVWSMAPPDLGASRPGSTAVAILVHAGGVEVAHVGDSRCYRVHAGKVAQLTKDHSLVQGLVDAGVVRPDEAKNHPDANRITRALGTHASVDVELAPAPTPLVANDQFLLCSDGLSDLVEPEDILSIAGTQPPAQAAGRLVDLANARGGHDNITVVIVRLREGASASQSNVAPTVAQTEVGSQETLVTPTPTEPIPPPGLTTPPLPVQKPARGHLTLIVGLVLAAIGLATAIVVLWFGTRSSSGVHPEAGLPAVTAPPPSSVPLTTAEVPQVAPPPGDLPRLHRPDGDAAPDLK